MRQFLLKVTLSSALAAGMAATAMACPSVTASQDDSAYLQLAQASGGSSGGGTSGSAPSTGSTTGTTTSPAARPPAGTGRPVIPPNTPMRDPITPRTPPQPGQSQNTSPAR